MKKIAACALCALFFAVPVIAKGSHALRAHITKNGTYVAPSRATNPNRTKADNYSTKGNVNLYNGKAGTK